MIYAIIPFIHRLYYCSFFIWLLTSFLLISLSFFQFLLKYIQKDSVSKDKKYIIKSKLFCFCFVLVFLLLLMVEANWFVLLIFLFQCYSLHSTKTQIVLILVGIFIFEEKKRKKENWLICSNTLYILKMGSNRLWSIVHPPKLNRWLLILNLLDIFVLLMTVCPPLYVFYLSFLFQWTNRKRLTQGKRKENLNIWNQFPYAHFLQFSRIIMHIYFTKKKKFILFLSVLCVLVRVRLMVLCREQFPNAKKNKSLCSFYSLAFFRLFLFVD